MEQRFDGAMKKSCKRPTRQFFCKYDQRHIAHLEDALEIQANKHLRAQRLKPLFQVGFL